MNEMNRFSNRIETNPNPNPKWVKEEDGVEGTTYVLSRHRDRRPRRKKEPRTNRTPSRQLTGNPPRPGMSMGPKVHHRSTARRRRARLRPHACSGEGHDGGATALLRRFAPAAVEFL
jgi:hypothetical protein